jgi:hypothetical protein
MKVLDYSPIPFDGGNLTIQDRIKGIARYGFTWVPEMKSQELVIANLNRVLDHRFTLLRNLPLPGRNTKIPMVLFGSHGVTVLYNQIAKGMYRAEGDSWEVMDNSRRDFRAVKPNLIKSTAQMVDVFKGFLAETGTEKAVDGVLIFTDPGTHVNSNRPDIRIILMDAIERFGISLLQKPQEISLEETRRMVEVITETIQPDVIKDEGDRIVPHQQFAENVDTGFLKALAPLQKRMNLSRSQWILLGVFAFLDVLVLIVFVILILMTA